MTSQRRRTFLVVSGLAILYAGFRIVPGLGREYLVFEEIDDPVEFRRLTAGKSSVGFDPFFGLEDPTENNQANAESRVRNIICASLHGDALGAGEDVPVASFSDSYCLYCRVQTKRLADMEARPASGIRVSCREGSSGGKKPGVVSRFQRTSYEIAISGDTRIPPGTRG